MGCDIHCAAEAYTEVSRRERLTDIQSFIEKIDRRIRRIEKLDGSWVAGEVKDLQARKDRRIAERDELLSPRRPELVEKIDPGLATIPDTPAGRAWRLLGAVFDSTRNSTYTPATREAMRTLTDGQLIDALSYEGQGEEYVRRSFYTRRRLALGRGMHMTVDEILEAQRAFDPDRDWTHRAFREALNDEACAAFDAWHAEQRIVTTTAVQRAMARWWLTELAVETAPDTVRKLYDTIEHGYPVGADGGWERFVTEVCHPDAIAEAVRSSWVYGDADVDYYAPGKLEYDEQHADELDVLIDPWADRLSAIAEATDMRFAPEDGWRTDEAVEWMQERQAEVHAQRRALVKLSPSARESIIAAADAYRPWASDDSDDPDEGRVDLSYARGAGEAPFKTATPFEGGNYDVFAMLANVRNGGFRGEPQRLQPIAMPRGLPDDVSASGEAFMARMGVDGHSHSYFTLAELEAVDWQGNTITNWGVLTEEQWKALRDDDKKPLSWASDIGQGGGSRMFTPAGYDAWVALNRPYFPEITGRSWLDDHVYVTPELLARALRGTLPIRPEGETPLNVGTPQVGVSLGGIDPETGEFPGVTGQVVVEREQLGREETREDAMARLGIDPGNPFKPSNLRAFVRAEWTTSWAQSAGAFVTHTLPELRRVADDLCVYRDEIRLIFYFDN